VLLSHLGDRGTEQVLNEVGGVDIALVGHVYRSLTQERIMNDAVLLAAVYDGRVIGRANLALSRETGQVTTVQVAITTLDATVADDPVMLGAVQQFLRDLDSRRDEQRAQFPRDRGSSDEAFLGESNCKACHTDIHQQWRQTSHARTFASLRQAEAQLEPECLSCHTTGYRHHNGYDEQRRTNLVQVQCEACHGYGTTHSRDGSMLAAARESCTQCHIGARPCFDERSGQEFDYVQYWERIAH
jgi:hypothetical protein